MAPEHNRTDDVAGRLLRALRRRAGISIEETAVRVGLPVAVLLSWEGGAEQPAPGALIRAAEERERIERLCAEAAADRSLGDLVDPEP